MQRESLLVVVVAFVGVFAAVEGKCGHRFHDQIFRSLKGQPEIVGGRDAVRGAFPWQVSIQMEQSGNKSFHFCGGSVIGHYWVVTAAHCINVYMEILPQIFHIAIGDHRRLQADGSEQIVDIDLIVKHEAFDANTIDNDIALIRTKQKITFDEYVQPVCLPSAKFAYAEGTPSYISGWGSTVKKIPDLGYEGASRKANRDSPNVLQAAKVPLVKSSECNAADRYQGLVTKNMFCAGYLAGGIDSCQGDSGGPLVIAQQSQKSADKRFVLIGITSWGVGCAAPNFPGVYTKVANYADWIQTHKRKRWFRRKPQ